MKKKNSNIIKLILKIIYNLLIVICVLVTTVIILQKVSDGRESVAGYRIFRVITGSMNPKYEVGEVVICKKTEGKDIKIGDAIVYKGVTGVLKDKVIMHEVVGINYDENNNLQFHAQGIANNEEDPEVKESQVYGVVKFKYRILTILYDLASTKISFFVIIVMLVINVFVSFKTSEKPKKIEAKKSPKVEKKIKHLKHKRKITKCKTYKVKYKRKRK